MGQDTKIEWAKHTFNPWIGCSKVAAGCQHCYADAQTRRNDKVKWGPSGTRVKTVASYWRKPLAWDRAAEKEGVRNRVFCASLADVFEDWQGEIVGNGFDEDVLAIDDDRSRLLTMNDLRRDLFKLIDATPHLDWLLLTKRPENILRMWPLDDGEPTPIFPGASGELGKPLPCKVKKHRKNVWLLTSVAEQKDADKNIPELLKCRCLSPVLGLSCEPLVGPVAFRDDWLTPPVHHHPDNDISNPDLVAALSVCARRIATEHGGAFIDWVIFGGESGPKSRPCSIEWIRSIRDQCKAAGVPVFVKQLGAQPIYQNSGTAADALFPNGVPAGATVEGGWVSSGDLPLRDPKGGDMEEWPEDLRVREFPCDLAQATS